MNFNVGLWEHFNVGVWEECSSMLYNMDHIDHTLSRHTVLPFLCEGQVHAQEWLASTTAAP